MYLVVIHSYLKSPKVFETSNIGAIWTIEVFKSIFRVSVFPHTWWLTMVDPLSVYFSTLTSSQNENYWKSINIKHTFSQPYHPATNGAAERFVETF